MLPRNRFLLPSIRKKKVLFRFPGAQDPRPATRETQSSQGHLHDGEAIGDQRGESEELRDSRSCATVSSQALLETVSRRHRDIG